MVMKLSDPVETRSGRHDIMTVCHDMWLTSSLAFLPSPFLILRTYWSSVCFMNLSFITICCFLYILHFLTFNIYLSHVLVNISGGLWLFLNVGCTKCMRTSTAHLHIHGLWHGRSLPRDTAPSVQHCQWSPPSSWGPGRENANLSPTAAAKSILVQVSFWNFVKVESLSANLPPRMFCRWGHLRGFQETVCQQQKRYWGICSRERRAGDAGDLGGGEVQES